MHRWQFVKGAIPRISIKKRGLARSYRMDRSRAREIALEGNAAFIEVFVDAPLAVCERRDPKNLYKKARAGQIREFTGIDAPYEAPEDPEIVVHTDRQSVDESVATILEQLLPRLRAVE